MTRESRLRFLADNWSLCYHTARNMQPRQLAGVAERKIRQSVVPSLPVDFDQRYEKRVPPTLEATPEPIDGNTHTLHQSLSGPERDRYLDRAREATTGTLTFLNDSIAVDDAGGVDWFHPSLDERPGLWALKFHGFEFLEWATLGAQQPAVLADDHVFEAWICDWDHSNQTRIGARQYLRRAWTPHAVSLRLLAWCRYYSWCRGEPAFLRRLRRLVYKNALFLAAHVEYDVGGNHLIENGAALAAAGSLFQGHDAGQRWLSRGSEILGTASDQFLADGGHFERSPMYHIQVLRRYLTVIDLLQRAGRRCPGTLERTAVAATGFLQALRPPDGRIPLLNDAVYSESLALETCLRYARAVGIEPPDRVGQRDALSSSGYYWLGQGPDRLLVDGGAFGPPHLPAHSHNDLFSILLWVDGTQLLTDTGTYEYAPTTRRQHARSVSGHNTVQVGESEPVDVAGRYLAGRRVTPTVQYRQGETTVFEGRYRKRSPSVDYAHRRQIYADSGRWLIRDTVTSDETNPVSVRLQFHPQVSLTRLQEGIGVMIDDECLAHLFPVGYSAIVETTCPYFPEFGEEQSRPAIRLETTTESERTAFLLSTEPQRSAVTRRLAQTGELPWEVTTP